MYLEDSVVHTLLCINVEFVGLVLSLAACGALDA